MRRLAAAIIWVPGLVLLGALASLPAIGVYYWIEWSLAEHEPHERGLVAGAAVAIVMQAGMSLARLLLKKSERKENR